MRLPGSFKEFTVDPVDNSISQIKGSDLKATGYRAALMTLPIPGSQAAHAFCLEHRQIDDAVRDWRMVYPKSRIDIVSHEDIETGSVKLTGGGPAYADEWIMVNGIIAVNPLAIRLIVFQKKSLREVFDGALQANGILADLV